MRISRSRPQLAGAAASYRVGRVQRFYAFETMDRKPHLFCRVVLNTVLGGRPENYYEILAEFGHHAIPQDQREIVLIDIDQITRQLHFVPFDKLPAAAGDDDESSSEDDERMADEDRPGEGTRKLLGIPMWDVR